MASEKKEEKNPTTKAGDMIEFPRKKRGYSHFGIADGKGNIIHATSDNQASGSVIKKEPLEMVAAGGSYKISNQDDKKTPLPPQHIVQGAEKRIGEKVQYDPVGYNCETVASEMRYGKGQGHSKQGEKIQESANIFLKNAGAAHNDFDGNAP